MHTSRQDRLGRHSGGTTLNVITALVAIVFFGLLAYWIFWIIRSFGQAGEQYGKAMVQATENATALKCEINMRSIWQCIQTYSTENDSLPPSQEELIRFCGDSRVFRCDEPNGLPYVYLAGQRLSMPESNVLVYEPVPVHQGKSVVLYLDGRIDTLDAEALKQAVEATRSRIRQNR